MAAVGEGETEGTGMRSSEVGGTQAGTEPPAVSAQAAYRDTIRRQTWSRARRMRPLYFILLFSLVPLVLFHYVPIYGLAIAFKDFRVSDGILRSPWNDFKHFRWLFTDPFFLRVLFNTVYLSVLRLVFAFPAPILLALLLNEMRSQTYKKVIQSISYLPHFISWVILGGIIMEVLSPQRGIVAYIATLLGRKPVNLLTQASTFRGLLVVTGIWQGVGWGSIIFLAALSSIDPGLYESASIDGANRLQKALFITLPSLVPVITILAILRVGRILDESFSQIYNLYNPLVYSVADVFDTYIYRSGIMEARYDYGAALGLFRNVVGALLLVGVNYVVKRFSEYALW